LLRENDLRKETSEHALMPEGNMEDVDPPEPLYIGPWLTVLGVTQAELSKKANINEGYLSQIISGKKQNPAFAKIARIADALGIPIDALRSMPPDKKTIEAIRSLNSGIVDRIQTSRRKELAP
jgi:transcriptional regulator with XRE-family HTH domain